LRPGSSLWKRDPKWARLAKSTDGKFLKLVSGYPAWAAHGLTASDVGADASGAASSAVSGHTSTYNHANYDTAYGWGNWASNFGTAAGKICQGNDSRLSDSRTPAAHNILSSSHGDTLADSVAAGDLLYGNATPKWARLAKSTDGKFLKLVSATRLGRRMA